MAGGVTGGRPVAPWKEAEVLVGVHQPPEYDVSCSFRQVSVSVLYRRSDGYIG